MCKKQKHLLNIFIIFIISNIILFLFLGIITKKLNQYHYDKSFNQDTITGQYQNVILMIGDGMGTNHIAYLKQQQYLNKAFILDDFPTKGTCITNSRSLIGPTDSAASATALSTGYKTDNGVICYQDNEKLENMAQFMKNHHKKVGIIVTEGVDGATPAAFSSHAKNRGDKEDIFKEQMASKIDLFIGSNKSYYDERKTIILENGYQYDSSIDILLNNPLKAFICYDNIINDSPSLDLLSLKAIDYLTNPQGFFLMIEGSHIDKFSHANHLSQMMIYLDNFIITVEKVYQNLPEDTLLIVTADHETGDFYNGIFHSTNHTASNVPYYIYPTINNLPSTIDNTTISNLIRQAVKNVKLEV